MRHPGDRTSPGSGHDRPLISSRARRGVASFGLAGILVEGGCRGTAQLPPSPPILTLNPPWFRPGPRRLRWGACQRLRRDRRLVPRRESISRLFSFEISVHVAGGIDLLDLLGQPASLIIHRDGAPRVVQGVVEMVEPHGASSTEERTAYRIPPRAQAAAPQVADDEPHLPDAHGPGHRRDGACSGGDPRPGELEAVAGLPGSRLLPPASGERPGLRRAPARGRGHLLLLRSPLGRRSLRRHAVRSRRPWSSPTAWKPILRSRERARDRAPRSPCGEPRACGQPWTTTLRPSR